MNQLRGWMGRRYAVGIDVNSKNVRIVLMSRRLAGSVSACIEHIGVSLMPADAMTGPELLDPSAVSHAIIDALGTFYSPRTAASLRVAMAIAPSATLVCSVASAQLEALPGISAQAAATKRHAGWRARLGLADMALDDLEPAVRAHAEALWGIERNTLAVDWFASRSPLSTPDHLTIAAAAREHIDARIEAATGAGLQLVAIDAEPVAALRACRYEAMRKTEFDEIYVVLWLGDDSTHLWAIHQGRPIRELRWLAQFDIPASLLASLAVFVKSIVAEKATGACHGHAVIACAFVAGNLENIIAAGITLNHIASVLDCETFEFSASCQCEGRSPVVLPALQPAALAVAFGLALRGILQ